MDQSSDQKGIAMQRVLPMLLVAVIGLSASPALADNKCIDVRTGINLPSPAFEANIPGREAFDYSFPSSSQIDYFAKVGFDSIRLAINWERLQSELYESLDHTYIAGIISVPDSAAENRADVLIDRHNYARYRRELIGSDAVELTRVGRAVALAPSLTDVGHCMIRKGNEGVRSRAMTSAETRANVGRSLW